MGSLVETLRRLGPVKLATMAVVAAALIGSFAFFASRINQPPMGLLFSELSAQDSGQIVAKLEAQNVPYELRAGGSQIFVPSDRVLRLRMSFAEQGVPRGGMVGYEIFDRGDTIGATNFVQTLNHVRALEGELSRTIASLGPISNARVHLVIPRRDLFSRERQEPTASVVLRLREAGSLPRIQVNAIQHLVASSVAGLKPARVSVIDDRGNLLARGQAEGEDSPMSTAVTADERRRSYEQRLARTIEELLERSVGAGKVRAEVTAEMDFDRIITNTESFDPDGQVVRSTQTVTESSDAKESSSTGAVSVTANLPEGDSSSQPGQNSNRTSRSEETVNYEITKTVKNHIREAGAVRRLSVAVLVDGATTVNSDGTRTYAPRSAEELERLTALAKSAIGFNQQRGDTIELANLAFAGVEPLDPGAPAPLLNLSRSEYFQIAWILVSVILGILVVLFFLRPIASGFYQVATADAAAGGAGTPLLPGRAGAAPAALAPPAAGTPELEESAAAAAAADAMIDLDRIEGRVKASSMKKIGEIVDKHPEEAVSIVRSWMYQEN
ncbi:MAG TPA: flagellar basal-body MS-ring/collar protein FliF [Alphaproteobacteria bacterium]|nr:flagellar basal-body MS-ring/collar protein FliF [Alphaproteobacteria bacterium]